MHVTMRARREAAFLRTERVYAHVRRALRTGQRVDFRIVHVSVQADHVHLLVEAEDGAALRAGTHGLATRLARAINAVLRRRGKVWEDRHHRRELRSPREVRNALAYVLLNHRKHDAASVLAWRGASVDPFSSATSFDGWTPRSLWFVRALLGDDEPASIRPVVPPRTWLLRRGWQRHALVDLREVPGRTRHSRTGFAAIKTTSSPPWNT